MSALKGPQQRRSLEAATAIFRAEYERISRELYNGKLPAWPGIAWTGSRDEYAHASWYGRKLHPFRMSALFAEWASERDFLNVVRHETAHVGCRWFGKDDGHGPDWQRHAIMCGASARPEYPPIYIP